jgi:hypothetical protein
MESTILWINSTISWQKIEADKIHELHSHQNQKTADLHMYIDSTRWMFLESQRTFRLINHFYQIHSVSSVYVTTPSTPKL